MASTVDTELRLLDIREVELLRRNAELNSQLQKIDVECEDCIQSDNIMLEATSRVSLSSLKPRKSFVTPTSAQSLGSVTEIRNESEMPGYFSKEGCATPPALVEVTILGKSHRRFLPCTSIEDVNKTSKECAVQHMGSHLTTVKTKLERNKVALEFATNELVGSQRQLQQKCKYIKMIENALREKEIKVDECEMKREEQQACINELKKEIQKLQNEVTSSQQFSKNVETEYKRGEVRISRAMEECTKYKLALSNATEEKRQSGTISREEKEGLMKQIKTLEQQRQELFTSFKRQMKLINILKGQKLIIEAAKVLTITEEEFMKVINWDAMTESSNTFI